MSAARIGGAIAWADHHAPVRRRRRLCALPRRDRLRVRAGRSANPMLRSARPAGPHRRVRLRDDPRRLPVLQVACAEAPARSPLDGPHLCRRLSRRRHSRRLDRALFAPPARSRAGASSCSPSSGCRSRLMAWSAAMRRDFISHERWMIRSFALTFAAVTLRLQLPIARLREPRRFRVSTPIASSPGSPGCPTSSSPRLCDRHAPRIPGGPTGRAGYRPNRQSAWIRVARPSNPGLEGSQGELFAWISPSRPSRTCCATRSPAWSANSTTSRRAARSRSPKPAGGPQMWSQFAELGLLGAPFAEADGGFGGGPVEAMIISEEFGKGLVIEPYLQTVIIGGGFLRHGGTAAQKEEHLADLIGGEAPSTPSPIPNRKSRYDLNDVSTTAKKDGAGYTLNGHKAVVIGAPFATHLIVTARTCGRPARCEGHHRLPRAEERQGRLDARLSRPSTACAPRKSISRTSSVGADAVIGEVDDGLPLVEKVVDEAIAALCAEAVGCMKVLNEATLDLLQDAQAVRPAHRQLPGAAAPHGRHVHGLRAVGLDDLHGDAEARRDRRRAQARRLRRQGADRQGRQASSARTPSRSMAAWA